MRCCRHRTGRSFQRLAPCAALTHTPLFRMHPPNSQRSALAVPGGTRGPLVLSPSGQARGMERQAALHLFHALRRGVPGERTLATQRSIAALPAVPKDRLGSGPGFLGRGLRHPVQVQQVPCRTVLVPPDSMPGAARGWGYEPQTQASAPCSAEMTSHDNALG